MKRSSVVWILSLLRHRVPHTDAVTEYAEVPRYLAGPLPRWLAEAGGVAQAAAPLARLVRWGIVSISLPGRLERRRDAAVNKTLKRDPRGNRISYQYDPLSRVVTEKASDGTRVSYAYDPSGNRTLLSDSTGRTSSTFDGKNRLASLTNPDSKRSTSAYDPVDHRVQLIDPDGGRFSSSYDAVGRLIVQNNPQGHRTTFALDPLGRQIGQVSANGARTSHAYDPAGQLTLVANTGMAGTVNRCSYSYDQAGHRLNVRESSGDRTSWTYDPSYQLLQEVRTGLTAFNVAYRYDPAGNRLVQIDSGVRTSSSYDAANELLVQNTAGSRVSFVYDNSGNRTQQNNPGSGITYYTWDVYNRLKVATPIAGSVTILYNGTGQRVRKQTPSLSKHYFYDLDKVLQEYNDSLTTTNEYTSTDEQYGSLLSAYSSGSTSYYQPDALGSTDALLNDSGSTTDRYAYRAFGLEATHQGTSSNDRTFVGAQGYVQDSETSLYFLRARYYDPVAGRFLNEDPSGYRGGDANLYRYTGNDPVNQIDPSGLAVYIGGSDTTGSRMLRVPLIPCSSYARYLASFAQSAKMPNAFQPPPSFWESLQNDYQQGSYQELYVTGPIRDRLQSDIFKDFGPWGDDWKNESDRGLGMDASNVFNQNGVTYYKVDLLNSLPPILWDHVEASKKTNKLAYKLDASRKDDFVAQLDENGNLTFTDKNQFTTPNTLLGWLRAFSVSVIGSIGHFVAEGAKALQQVGLVGFLRLIGIDPDTFQSAIDKFQDLAKVVGQIAINPFGFVANLISGGLEGFAKFADGFPSNVINLAVDWLFSKLDAFVAFVKELPTTFGFTDILAFVFRVAGLTVKGITDLVTRVLGAGSLKLQEALAVVWEALGDPPTFEKLQTTISDWVKKAGQAVYQLGEVFDPFLAEIPRLLQDWGVQKLKELAVTLVFPGGAAVLGIWRTIIWAVGKISELGGLFGTIGEALGKAATGSAGVATSVLEGLKKFTGLALSLVATQLGADYLLQTLNQSVGKVLGWLSAKLEALLRWLLSPFSSKSKPGPGASGGCSCGACQAGKPGTPGKQAGTPVAAPGKPNKTGCWRAGMATWTQAGTRAIERLVVGEALEGAREEERKHLGMPHWVERDRTKLRVVQLVREADGCRHEVERLFHASWLELQGAGMGKPLWIELPEQGLMGEMVVMDIGPCPELPPAGIPMVVGRFCHTGARTIELRVQGEAEPWGVTPSHLIWSVDREDWVEAGKLRVGERLQGRNGVAMVLGVEWTLGEEPVYNIEVDGDHCYRVGQQGLLVHNNSVDACPDLCKDTWGLNPTPGKGFVANPHYKEVSITYKTPTTQKEVTRNIFIVTGAEFRLDAWANVDQLSAEGKRTSDDTRCWARRIGDPTDEAGHVIPKEFGGKRKVGQNGNIVPMSGRANNFDTSKVIALIKSYNSKKQNACAKIYFDYTDDKYPNRPKVIKWEIIYQDSDGWHHITASMNAILQYNNVAGDLVQNRPSQKCTTDVNETGD